MANVRVRPPSVTIVVVLLWISFALILVSAIAAFFAGTGLSAAGNEEQIAEELRALDLPASWAPAVGPIFLVIGGVLLVLALIQALFAVFISKGSNVARILLTVILVIRLVTSILGMFTASGNINILFGTVLSVGLDIVILFLLYNAQANSFFTDKVRAVP